MKQHSCSVEEMRIGAFIMLHEWHVQSVKWLSYITVPITHLVVYNRTHDDKLDLQ